MSASDDLFCTINGEPINFYIPICEEKDGIKGKIEEYGGEVVSAAEGKYTISLLPADQVKQKSQTDVFSTQYIYDCIEHKKLLDLNGYRIGTTVFDGEVDVNNIMLRESSWDNCKRPSIEDLGEEISDIEDDSSPMPTSRKLNPSRREYNYTERRAILNYIIKHNKYEEVKGRAMWQKMEMQKICPGRSWESLKEHFRKKIMSSLQLYNLSDKVIKCLKNQQAYSPDEADAESDSSTTSIEENGNGNQIGDHMRKINSEKQGSKSLVQNEREESITQERGQKLIPIKQRHDVVNDVTSKDMNDGLVEESESSGKESVSSRGGKIRQSQGRDTFKESDCRMEKIDKEKPKASRNDVSQVESKEIDEKEDLVDESEQSVREGNKDYGDCDSQLEIPPQRHGSHWDIDRDDMLSRRQEERNFERESPCHMSDDGSNLSDSAMTIIYCAQKTVIKKEYVSEGERERSSESEEHEQLRFDSSPPMNSEVHLPDVISSTAKQNTEPFEITSYSQENTCFRESLSKSASPSKKKKDICDQNSTFNDKEHFTERILSQMDPIPPSLKNGKVRSQISENPANVTKSTAVRNATSVKDASDVFHSPEGSSQEIEDFESCCDELDGNTHKKKETIVSKGRKRYDYDSQSLSSDSSQGSEYSRIIFNSLSLDDQQKAKQQNKERVCKKQCIGTDSDSEGDSEDHNFKSYKRPQRLKSSKDKVKEKSMDMYNRCRKTKNSLNKKRHQKSDDDHSSSEEPILLRRNTNHRRLPSTANIPKQVSKEDKSLSDNESPQQSDSDDSMSSSISESNMNLSSKQPRQFRNKQKADTKHTTKKLGMAYTKEEDIRILKYLIKYKVYKKTKGNEMWQEMQRRIFPGRTWHGLRERYLKRIIKRLPTYVRYGLTQEDIGRLSRCDSKESNNHAEEQNDTMIRKRKAYTRDDDYLILQFITTNKRHSQIGGKMMWELMSETVEGLEGRSWLSLKERFRRVIMKRLRTYKISEDDLRQFGKHKERHSRAQKRNMNYYFKAEEERDSDSSSDSASEKESDSVHESKVSHKIVHESKASNKVKRSQPQNDSRETVQQVINRHLSKTHETNISCYSPRKSPKELKEAKLSAQKLPRGHHHQESVESLEELENVYLSVKRKRRLFSLNNENLQLSSKESKVEIEGRDDSQESGARTVVEGKGSKMNSDEVEIEMSLSKYGHSETLNENNAEEKTVSESTSKEDPHPVMRMRPVAMDEDSEQGEYTGRKEREVENDTNNSECVAARENNLINTFAESTPASVLNDGNQPSTPVLSDINDSSPNLKMSYLKRSQGLKNILSVSPRPLRSTTKRNSLRNSTIIQNKLRKKSVRGYFL